MDWDITVGIFTVVHFLGVLCIIPALLYTRTPQGAIAWIMTLVVIPFIAVPMYLIFGPRRFNGYIAGRKKLADSVTNLSEHISQGIAHLDAYKIDPDSVHNQTLSTLSKQINLPITNGNDCKILIDAQRAFPEINEAILKAKDYVLVEFFIIKNDKTGKLFQELLIDRAKAGIKVFVIYDEIGSRKLPPGYIKSLRNAGVHIESFNGKRMFLRNIVRVNFRNHRKLVVVDGISAFVGGMNIGQEYLGEGELGYWRDTFVKLNGPSVQEAQMCFLDDWNWANHYSPKVIPEVNWQPTICPENKNVLILPSGPVDAIPGWKSAVILMANLAKRRLWIASPYFVPDEAVLSALQMAAHRGVDVRVLRPHKADHILVKLSSLTYLPEIEPYGLQIWDYQLGFLHQKVILMDNDLAAIGTANLDNRSLTLNFELMAFIQNAETCKEVEKMLDRDFQNSTPVDADEYEKRSIFFKLLCQLSRLLAPIQ